MKNEISALKRERVLRGIKQIEIADKTGIVYNVLSMIENRHREATPDQRRKLAQALGVPEKKLFPEGK